MLILDKRKNTEFESTFIRIIEFYHTKFTASHIRLKRKMCKHVCVNFSSYKQIMATVLSFRIYTRTSTYLKLGERVLVLVHAEALFLEVGDRVLHSVHPLHEILQSAQKSNQDGRCRHDTHADFTGAYIKTK